MEHFKLQQPDPAKHLSKALDKAFSKEVDLSRYLTRTSQPEYLFWDRIRHIPRPDALTAEEFWALIKFSRNTSPRRTTPIKDKQGQYFTWWPIPGLDSFFHEVDMHFGGKLELGVVTDATSRQRFISRGIMEEAIASSQLEGASTTRRVAKQMIVEKRKPRNKSEQMILNNYKAMILIEEQLQREPLSESKLLDLHTILTKDTIEEKDLGRFRTNNDQVIVMDPSKGVIYHVPPDEKFLKGEIFKLIDFANDVLKEPQFAHPVIKAIILHFWIGYLHPFVDGNGRLARVLFYWYLLRHEYWAFAYLPLSRVIKTSPGQYRDAYVYSEQDDRDLNYFIDYNVRKILQAKREFENYIRRVEAQNKEMARIARGKYRLNFRQIQLLRMLQKEPTATTTIRTHSSINQVSRLTARKDLEQLEKLGFLKSSKIGKERPFSATRKIIELFG